MFKQLIFVFIILFSISIAASAQEASGGPTGTSLGSASGGETSGGPTGTSLGSASGGETSGGPTGTSLGSASGGNHPPVGFAINISSNKTQVHRASLVCLNFQIEIKDGSNDDAGTISIKLSDDFEQVSSKYYDNKLHRIDIPWNTSIRKLDISAVAQVSKNHDLKDICLDKHNIDFSTIPTNPSIGSCILNVTNSLPQIIEFRQDNSTINDEPYFRKDEIDLNLLYNDEDDEELYYRVYTNPSASKGEFIKIDSYDICNKNKFIKIPFSLNESGSYSIYIELSDLIDSGYGVILPITVSEETKRDHKFNTPLNMLIYILVIILIAISLGFIITRKVRYITIIVFGTLCIIYIIIFKVCDMVDLKSPTYLAIAFYPLIFIIIFYFIMQNFPERNYKNYLYYSISTFLTAVSMSFLLYLSKMNFDLNNNTLYLYYYSTLIQFYGTILAIISGFSIFMLDGRFSKSDDLKNFKRMLRLFVIFYSSIILMAALGLTTGHSLLLDLDFDIIDIVSGLAMLSFEYTFILIGPALVVLYAFVDWVIDKTHIQHIHFKKK